MGVFSADNPWVFISGLLGNITSFVVFLAPLPTFIRIWKKKSTQGFQSIPYVVSLFSAMLWIYYAFVKSGAFLLITINSFGCVVETIYIAIYIAYAPKQSRMLTLRILVLLDCGVFFFILLLVQFLTKGSNRVEFLGWICVAFATSVFAAPLSIMRQVIITKSVEFMPFHLSLMLTFSAVAWLLYGIFLKDLHIAIPNVLGLVFGILQMVLYAMYRNHKTAVIEEDKVPQHTVDVKKLGAVLNSEAEEISSSEPQIHDNDHHHHETIAESCKLQNQSRDHDDDHKIFELHNSNQMLGTCEA
ncbi:Bidirectional sugar transporter SWEET14 [Hibiscus syriacus]|uniref:Bidirectional sugar transporter SWEET n=1 Tax=Hibiscus syriacus TaxID=106335 RepID=A0A6A3AFZ3_HIBSY|nr:bidirectional sugar transporter SWEET12-like [Hibiscus syriacus]KAE8703500.1 Bidirectional sugar transporter SWEET14 [Hibiscus syriacus]